MTIQDVRLKKTPLKIGETEYTLAYDLNAFAELEDIYGTLDKAHKAIQKGSMKAILDFLWAGLLRDQALSKKEVGTLLDIDGMFKATPIILDALAAATPKQPETKGDSQPEGE